MKKKWLAVTMACVMMLSLLAGCGGGGQSAGNSDTPGTPNTNGSTGSSPKEGTVTIKFHSWYDDQEVRPIIDAFEQEYPNIKVDHITLLEGGTAEDSMKKLDMLVSSGEEMDAAFITGSEGFARYIGLGLLEPLDPFFEKEGVKFDDVYKAGASVDGTIYGVPGSYEDRFVLLNKDHLDEANLPVPTDWTWDEFKEYALKLTKGEGANKRYGTYFHTWPEFARLWMNNQPKNSSIVLTDGTLNVNNDLARNSLSMRYEMENVDKSAVPYADAISQKLHYRPLYMTGKVSMIVIGNWMASEAGGTDKLPATFKTVFAPYPKNKKDDPIGYNPAATEFMGVYTKSKHKEETYKFIRFYTTKGLELQGKHFSSWKDQSLEKIIDSVLSTALTPENVDKESLLYTMENSKAGEVVIPPSYQSEIDDAFKREYELYLLGKQDLETTISNTEKSLQKVVDSNK